MSLSMHMFEPELQTHNLLITKSILCTSPCIFCLENPLYHFPSISSSLRPQSLLTFSPSFFSCWLRALPHAHGLQVRTSSALGPEGDRGHPLVLWTSILLGKLALGQGLCCARELIPFVPCHHHCQAHVRDFCLPLLHSSAPSAASSAVSFGCPC